MEGAPTPRRAWARLPWLLAALPWAFGDSLGEETVEEVEIRDGINQGVYREICLGLACLVAVNTALFVGSSAGSARVKHAAAYAKFVLSTLGVAAAMLFDVGSDVACLVLFFYAGLPLMSSALLCMMLLAPVICWMFVKRAKGNTPWWHLPFYILHMHVFGSLRASFKRGRKEFGLVWAAVIEACFQTYYAAFLEIYMLAIAPEHFQRSLQVPVLGHIVPAKVVLYSFIVGVINLGKVLAVDMDYYGYGRLELRVNQAVIAYRWERGRRSDSPAQGQVKGVKEYCTCVLFDGEAQPEEIPTSWLTNVESIPEMGVVRRMLRLVFRVAEVTHTTLTLTSFAALCRREGLSVHHTGNFWPILLMAANFIVMLLLVRRSKNTQFNWMFAAMFIVASPPLMFSQFRGIQVWHAAYRLGQFAVMSAIVLMKVGVDDTLRRLEEVVYIRRLFILSSVVYLVLLPVQYYLELWHLRPARRRSSGFSNNSSLSSSVSFSPLVSTTSSTGEGDSPVPRLMRAAILEDNLALVQMYSKFLPMDGALQFALERGAKIKTLLELLSEPDQVLYDGVLETALACNAPEPIIARLLECGGTPRDLPLAAALEKGASAQEILKLFEYHAEVAEERTLQCAVEHDADPAVFRLLLERGAAPAGLALQHALEQGWQDDDVLAVLQQQLELYEGVLDTACDYDASTAVRAQLLRRGGRPRVRPMREAFSGRHRGPEEVVRKSGSGGRHPPTTWEVQSLLEAGAETYAGVLKDAVRSEAPWEVICLLVARGCDLGVVALEDDLSQPLSSYWVNTSHNTYLSGAQIHGTASVQMYVDVLRSGCRCVEIDCWDGPGGDPVVTHGYTWTTKVRLVDVAEACRQHAFEASDYPLILSIEMRCSKPQMVRCGQIFRDVFEDLLLLPPEDSAVLVSPESAKGKVIIKSKLAQLKAGIIKGGGDEGDQKEDFCDQKAVGTMRSSSLYEEEAGRATTPSLANSFSCFHPDAKAADVLSAKELKRALTEYNASVYLPGKKFKAEWLEKGARVRESQQMVCSLMEARMLELESAHGERLRKYHDSYLTRVYPPGTNIDSSNYDPVPHWLCGAQLVALNFQTPDQHLLLNHGLFRHVNGNAGYVLKPPSVCGPAREQTSVTVRFSNFVVYGLHQLHEVEADMAHLVLRATVHCASGESSPRCREWCATRPSGGRVPFVTAAVELPVSQPDAALVSFEVYLDLGLLGLRRGSIARRYLAAAAFPLRALRSGVRWLPLWDHLLQPRDWLGLVAELEISAEA